MLAVAPRPLAFAPPAQHRRPLLSPIELAPCGGCRRPLIHRRVRSPCPRWSRVRPKREDRRTGATNRKVASKATGHRIFRVRRQPVQTADPRAKQVRARQTCTLRAWSNPPTGAAHARSGASGVRRLRRALARPVLRMLAAILAVGLRGARAAGDDARRGRGLVLGGW
jgi:hypothetical protein